MIKYILFKDSATVHVTCVMCYTGIELHCAQGVLRYLLVRISSARGSQMKFKGLCTPLSSLKHMGCTLCQFLWQGLVKVNLCLFKPVIP